MDEERRAALLALARLLSPHVAGRCAADRWLVEHAVSELDRICTGAPLYSPFAHPVRAGEAR